VFRTPAPFFLLFRLNDSLVTISSSLKEYTARMNYTFKHKVTGHKNRQTAVRTANASLFILFSTAHFLKTILASRTNGTFVFCPTNKLLLRNTKRAI
jgi:hypothetical protein